MHTKIKNAIKKIITNVVIKISSCNELIIIVTIIITLILKKIKLLRNYEDADKEVADILEKLIKINWREKNGRQI